MQYMLLFFNIFICIFEIYILYDFYHTLFDVKKIFRNKQVAVVALFTTVVFLINRFDSTVINLMFIPIVYLMLNLVVFKGNIFKRLFATIMGIIVIYGSELGVIAVLNITAEEMIQSSMINKPTAVLMTIIVKLVTYIIFAIIKQICGKSNAGMDIKNFSLYMIVPVSSLGIMFSSVYCGIDFHSGSSAEYILITFFILLIIGNVAIFYGFNKYAETLLEKEESKTILMKQELELEGYKKLEIANNKYLTLLHDTNHYVKSIYGLLKHNNTSEALKILESLTDEYDKSDIVEYSGNTILNTILSDYKRQADEMGVEYDIFIERGFNVEYVDEIDLVSMISNILSNAFSATVKCEKKYIKVQMFMQNDGCFSVIKVLNTFDGELKIEGNILRTTQENDGIHGKGIRSVETIAEKYNGYMQNSWEDGMFKSVLILENITFEL